MLLDLDQVEGPLLGLEILTGQLDLALGVAQVEIAAGDIRQQADAHALAGGFFGLQQGLGLGGAGLIAAKEIKLPVGLQIGLGDVHRLVVGGIALVAALAAGPHADVGQQAGLSDAMLGAGLLDPGFGDLQGLVVVQSLDDQGVEGRVAEMMPPCLLDL